MKFSSLMAGTQSLAWAIAALIGLNFGTEARADLVLNMSSVVGADVDFDGTGTTGSFSFNNNGSGQGFQITSSSGTGDAAGLYGTIGGTFSYATSSIVSELGGVLQTASLTTSDGSLTITDGNHQTLTATIAGLNVTTLGTSGVVNVSGAINLSDVVYSGTNTDLLALKTDANANGGVFTLTFQFVPGLSLTQLAASGAVNETSYSATIQASSFGITSVPEPSSLALGCIGTLALAGFGICRRKVEIA
jgi:hypothetical protein